MTTLAAVSAGGHLHELLDLLPRIEVDGRMVFATYDIPQARELLADEVMIPVHHPTTRSSLNALRNLRLARRLLQRERIDRVVSTGAGVAVPFLYEAARRGIPCHYIESATRVSGPSLSGRLLQRARGVHLYRQLGSWGEPRWQQGPTVFDGYEVTAGTPRPIERVLVSLGTHRFPFPRLVQQLAECFRGSTIDVLWQLGSTPDPGGLPGTVLTTLPSDRLIAEVGHADAVVGHAGVGLALTALRAGTVPVLVPRNRAHREHTDDHQVQLAEELGARGLAVHASSGEVDLQILGLATARTVTYTEPAPFELAG